MWLQTPARCELSIGPGALGRPRICSLATSTRSGARRAADERLAKHPQAGDARGSRARRLSACSGLLIRGQQGLLDQLAGILVDHLGVLIEKVSHDDDR